MLRRRLDALLHPARFYRWRRYQRSRPAHTNLFLITMNHGGTHWLRQMMALALVETHQLDEELEDIKNFDLVPPFHQKQFRFKYERDHGIVRMQQAHSPYRDFHFKGQRVLLLVRDLRDALVSHFRSYKSKKNPDAVFSTYLRGTDASRHGNSLGRRIEFLNSWSENANRTLAFKLARFEDLKADTNSALKDILEWAEFPNITDEIVQRCVDGASIDRMKKLEGKMQEATGIARPAKIREGSIAGYRDWFSDEDRDFFQSKVATKLKDTMGYDYQDW